MPRKSQLAVKQFATKTIDILLLKASNQVLRDYLLQAAVLRHASTGNFGAGPDGPVYERYQ